MANLITTDHVGQVWTATKKIVYGAAVGTSNAINPDNKLHVINVTSNMTLSLSKAMTAGAEIHILARNTGSSAYTLTIPSTIQSKSCYVVSGDNPMTVPAGTSTTGLGEINIVFDGNNYWARCVI